MVASYYIVPYLQHYYALLVTSNAAHDYRKRYIAKCCNIDLLGVLLIYQHSPSGTTCLRDCTYISFKPLAAVLQPIIIILKFFLNKKGHLNQ